MKNHLNRIIDLKLQMYEEAGRLHLLAENPRGIIAKDYQNMYDSGTAMHFLKFQGDEIVAMAGPFIKDDLPFRYYKERQYGFIGDVYVKPGHRNKGYATASIQACVQWLKDKNIEALKEFIMLKKRKDTTELAGLIEYDNDDCQNKTMESRNGFSSIED
jgi:GNAT superfamily N-acetyltransferase